MEWSLPSKRHRHNSSPVLSYFEEGWLCQVEVLWRRIAPSSSTSAGRTEVCNSNNNRPRFACFWVINTRNCKTCPTRQAIVVQSRACSCSVYSISLSHQIPVTTCTSCMYIIATGFYQTPPSQCITGVTN